MKRLTRALLAFLLAFSSLSIDAISPFQYSAFATLDATQLENFAQNNILFYDPSQATQGNCISSRPGGNVSGSNVNYAGVQVFSDADIQVIEANQPIYQEAADRYNFPWQVLAILHNLETGLRRYNPSNGQGVYQLYSYTGGGTNQNRFAPADSITEEEFRRQTIIAAEEVSRMAGDLNNTDNVKRLFFQYNGVAQTYIDKAIALGFSEEKAQNGEGSPYVMNRYDAARDPTSASMNPAWPGRYVADGVYDPSATMSGFGAFVQYEALAGTGICSTTSNNIAEVALEISWEGQNSHSMYDPKPEYVEAMKATGVWNSLGGYPPEGASCDRFVSTVMRYSGADPNFPLGAVSTQEDYMRAHPEMYQKIEHHDDYSVLEPGDIFISYAQHIYLYVGEINGQLYQASASYGDRTGEHFPGVYFSDNYGGVRYYNVYRRINY
jgi:hypothetical protein